MLNYLNFKLVFFIRYFYIVALAPVPQALLQSSIEHPAAPEEAHNGFIGIKTIVKINVRL